MLPEKIRLLNVSIGDGFQAGQLIRASTYEFRYLQPDPEQPAVALLMPPRERLTWQDGDLFPPMDQNLPEGDLFMKIRELFPKQPMTPMHMLALVGRNGIGRLGFSLPDRTGLARPRTLSKEELLKTAQSLLMISHGSRSGLFGMGCKARCAVDSAAIDKCRNAADRPKRPLPEGLERNRAIGRPARLHGHEPMRRIRATHSSRLRSNAARARS